MKINSIIGPLYLTATEIGLSGIYFKKPKFENSSNPNVVKILKKASIQLIEYFENKRNDFNIPLDLKGSDFQKKVWTELLKIPFGKTCSYIDIAKKIKNPKASRAVGAANGKNPICIIIPCHRVIAANGKLGGYSGGLDKKTKLLQLENIILNNQ